MTTREQAIRLCEVSSCEEFPPTILDRLQCDLDIVSEAVDLADEAYIAVLLDPDFRGTIETECRRWMWCEAAALLRDGWSP